MNTITINGKDYEVKGKARLWRILSEFQDKRVNKKIPAEDFVDEHCKIIAAACGLTLDEVLDNIDIEDVVPATLEIVKILGDKLTEKMLKKSQEENL